MFKRGGSDSGGQLSLSANGSSSGILWALGSDNAVHAFNASDISAGELWNSSMNRRRDSSGPFGHWQWPTIVNGKVFVPTGAATIEVYGLLGR